MHGPTLVTDRALGPDLARGFMLLFIALANSHYFLRGSSVLGGYPQEGTAVDSAVIWLLSTFVDGRAFPLFGLLFGYGVARIADRQRWRGPRGVRWLLWRRAAVLIAVGLVDAMLFYVGDILAMYGVLLIAGAWLVHRRDRWLLVVAVALTALNAIPSADLSTVSAAGPDPSMLPPDPVAMVIHRLPVALVIALVGPLGFAAPFAVGLWAGRRRILERPPRWLTTVAAGGIGAAVLGAQPIALALAGAVAPPGRAVFEALGALHATTGLLGGFGYAAAAALLASRLARRPGRVTTAIAATGQRSMSCYLLQSVTWAVVFTPFLLDLSGALSVTTTALLATATWAATVVLADRMRRAGQRGPFETLVRRVTYGTW
ncbi:DUF418 domain-containing protein [Catenuloplanes atrovinosus]|uniref:Membrane protein YeiB n=1 Tax=Catenuloplanes atrovinosus TaxID=137266 RepID=A0AAE4CC89_9ACTN|nr:DUF418 domain-containing protein [Catenuloplanes atrovinosus]MDR7276300.1 putative membrane protein YeiB [Catenuloplanes atrovinosus]